MARKIQKTCKFDSKLIEDLEICKKKHGTPVNLMIETGARMLVNEMLREAPALPKKTRQVLAARNA